MAKQKIPKKVKSKPITEEDRERMLSLSIRAGVKRSQICEYHGTMKIGGKCRKCEWAKKPKRQAKEPLGKVERSPESLNEEGTGMARSDTGRTVDVS